ncbi:MAG: hypothetical protein AAGF11_18195 [Myxococcota bacterium]
MTHVDGKAVLEAILYVRDFHRTAANMLLAADGPLSERGWAPHSTAWKPIPAATRSLQHAGRWLPHYILRQYYRENRRDDRELLSLIVVPYDPIDQRLEEPLCLASRMRALTDGDELYWLPQLQLRTKAAIGPFGEIRHITKPDLNPKPARLQHFEASVGGGELLSLAVPLMTITDETSLVAELIKPILDAQYRGLDRESSTSGAPTATDQEDRG